MIIKSYKCDNCGKRRVCAGHWAYILTPDGQDVEGYDQEFFCIECSKERKMGYGWSLYTTLDIKGKRFITNQ